MIEIRMKNDNFESDIRSIVKAFYPNEYLYVKKEETRLEVQKRPTNAGETIFTLEIGDDFKDKNELKRFLYDKLSKETGISLKWGTLTGIRPTKIPYALLDEMSEEEITKYMKETYLTSEEKAHLSIYVAKKEKEVLGRRTPGGHSLYVHIPFCPTRCAYCSFAAYPVSEYENRLRDYIDALKKELLAIKSLVKESPTNAIYFGGGTPTSLTEPLLYELCECVKENFLDENVREWTIEAGRPDSITKEKLEIMKEAGVTRISVNPQTMNQKTLDIIGRRHGVEDVENAFVEAREVGFNNINMDIILGLPNEGKNEVEHTLREIERLQPDSLTVHSLAIKHKADMNLSRENYEKYTLENSDEFMKMAFESAKKIGLEPYYLYRQKNMVGNQENIGFSRDGKEGIYNILIMEELESIFSAGAGGITKIVKTPGILHERIENVKDVDSYINRIDEMIARKMNCSIDNP